MKQNVALFHIPHFFRFRFSYSLLLNIVDRIAQKYEESTKSTPHLPSEYEKGSVRNSSTNSIPKLSPAQAQLD